MAANDLTTLANAYAWTNASPGSDDATLARLITTFSTRIQSWIGYNVLQSTYNRTFNGEGTRKFYVPDLPLQSVQSLVIDSFVVPAGVIAGNAQQAGYYNDRRCIGLIGYMFHKGFQNITASYTAGFTTVPDDIEQACLEWLKIAYYRKSSGVGADVQQVKAGDTSITWSPQSVATTDETKVPIPTAITAMLIDYKRLAQVAGM